MRADVGNEGRVTYLATAAASQIRVRVISGWTRSVLSQSQSRFGEVKLWIWNGLHTSAADDLRH